jgi:hypothetical protein
MFRFYKLLELNHRTVLSESSAFLFDAQKFVGSKRKAIPTELPPSFLRCLDSASN